MKLVEINTNKEGEFLIFKANENEKKQACSFFHEQARVQVRGKRKNIMEKSPYM